MKNNLSNAGWSVDLESAIVKHTDGWVFKFSTITGEPGVWEGECIAHPPIEALDVSTAARLSREAGDVFMSAHLEQLGR